MDQIKIGKFIAECRKKNNMTQLKLAEKLNITDRAISKWENGKSMPDYSVILDLCRELKISVNDLLCGEVVKMDNYNKNLENNLLEMIKQKQQSDKKLLLSEIYIGLFSTIIFLSLAFVASFVEMQTWLRILLIVIGIINFIIGVAYAIKIEQVAGYYECGKCHHTFIPEYKDVFFAIHAGRTRYLKCPKCNQRSWNKKVINNTN